MKKLLLILIPVIIATAAGFGTYRAYLQMKTLPANSIKVIRAAISNHDPDTFEKYVDVDSVLNSAADEILTAQINSATDSRTYSMQDLENVFAARKTEFLQVSKIVLHEYLLHGQYKYPEQLNETQKEFKVSDITSCRISGISKPVTSGGEAKAKIGFYNESLKFSFEIEITMEKADNSNWKIVSATGFENYIAGLKIAMKKKLNALNAPIRDKIDDIFIIKSFEAGTVEGDAYGFSRTLRLAIKADVKSDKPLYRIVGNIILQGRDGKEGITPFAIDMAYHPQGLQTFNVDKVLNPFVKADSDAMKHGLKKSEIHIEIVEIDFLDGTVLKQLDRLPD